MRTLCSPLSKTGAALLSLGLTWFSLSALAQGFQASAADTCIQRVALAPVAIVATRGL
ncbi:MAG: hypothetical protein ACR2I0_07790 [Rhodoferax sp.]